MTDVAPWAVDGEEVSPTPKQKAERKRPPTKKATEPEPVKINKAAQAILDEYEDDFTSEITPTGKNNTITKADVVRYLDSFNDEEEDGGVPEQPEVPDEEQPGFTDDMQPPPAPPTDQHDPELLALLQEWKQAADYVEEVKPYLEHERELRKRVAEAFVPALTEGANNVPLKNGYMLKVTHKVTRKVDEALLQNSLEELHALGVNPMAMIDWKPSLRTKFYRMLTPDQTEAFDEILTTSPATPAVEIVAPAGDDE